MKKQKNIPEHLIGLFFTYNFYKAKNLPWPEPLNKEERAKRNLLVEAFLDLPLSEFPSRILIDIIDKVERRTGKKAQIKAKTIKGIVRSLA